MGKILLITTKYTKGNDNKWLTNEIAEYASAQGNEVNVLSLNWQSYENGTENYNSNGVNVIRHSLPKFFYRKNFLCSILKLSFFSIVSLLKFRKKIKKNDVILITSPCIATWALCFIKGRSSNVLILWDFFPYFMSGFWVGIKRRITPLLSLVEGFLYNQFQSIGVMTPGYEKFLKEKFILKDGIEIFHFPLWTNVEKKKEINKAVLRNKLGFSATDFILIYGGAISKVQQLDNLMRLAEMTLADKKLKYLIVGGGGIILRSKILSMKKIWLMLLYLIQLVEFNMKNI
ncbi:hypothetical protein [Aeromonas hydrophila]|uniref:hypothetical protein n=1 Tax=Aeromonas hydrophila TaxID=644 RepID=UPI003D215146